MIQAYLVQFLMAKVILCIEDWGFKDTVFHRIFNFLDTLSAMSWTPLSHTPHYRWYWGEKTETFKLSIRIFPEIEAIYEKAFGMLIKGPDGLVLFYKRPVLASILGLP